MTERDEKQIAADLRAAAVKAGQSVERDARGFVQRDDTDD